MLFSWFDAREAKAFGTTARRDADRAHADRGQARQAHGREEARGDAASARAARLRFGAEHKLNAYKTAQLGNTLQVDPADKGTTPSTSIS